MDFLEGGAVAMAYNRTLHLLLADERKVGPLLADDLWQGLYSLYNYVKGVTDASVNIAPSQTVQMMRRFMDPFFSSVNEAMASRNLYSAMICRDTYTKWASYAINSPAAMNWDLLQLYMPVPYGAAATESNHRRLADLRRTPGPRVESPLCDLESLAEAAAAALAVATAEENMPRVLRPTPARLPRAAAAPVSAPGWSPLSTDRIVPFGGAPASPASDYQDAGPVDVDDDLTITRLDEVLDDPAWGGDDPTGVWDPVILESLSRIDPSHPRDFSMP